MLKLSVLVLLVATFLVDLAHGKVVHDDEQLSDRAFQLQIEKRLDESLEIYNKLCDRDYKASCGFTVSLILRLASAESKNVLTKNACERGLSGCATALELDSKIVDTKYYEARLTHGCANIDAGVRGAASDNRDDCRTFAAWLFKQGKHDAAIEMSDLGCRAKDYLACQQKSGMLHLRNDKIAAENFLKVSCVEQKESKLADRSNGIQNCREVAQGRHPSSITWQNVTQGLVN